MQKLQTLDYYLYASELKCNKTEFWQQFTIVLHNLKNWCTRPIISVLSIYFLYFFTPSFSLAFCGNYRWPVWLSHLLYEEDDITFICGPAEAWECSPAASLLLQSCADCHSDLSDTVRQASDWQQQEEPSRHRYVWGLFFVVFFFLGGGGGGGEL